MSRKAKRGFAASFCLVFLIAVVVYFLRSPRGTAATAQVLPDLGAFRVGSELGEERASFSGRPKVQVFATAEPAEWTALSSCLESPQVEAEMGVFTGILIDEAAEPTVEDTFRERDGLRVVVRALNGGFLGGLPQGFTCDDLVGLLRSLRQDDPSEPERSPIYANLLESPAVIDYLSEKGERARAERFVALLEEFEGATSPAVQAAKARLGQ